MAKGELVYVIGPSGSGKSTLLHLILGFDRPAHGSVLVGGRAVDLMSRRELREHRRRIGFVPAVAPWPRYQRMIQDNVDAGLKALAGSRQRQAVVVPRLVSLLGAQSLPRYRSGEYPAGEARRLAIARALVHDPPVLLLDGPLEALDPDNQLEVIRLIHRVNQADITVIAVMNWAMVVNHVPRRTLRFGGGRMLADAPKDPYG